MDIYQGGNPQNYGAQGIGQMPVSSDEIYAEQLQEERVKNIIEQIAPDNQLMELQWRIKGYIKDPYTKQWKKINETAPEPNDLLVSRYISYLSSILNQNTTLSNYSSMEINKIMGLCINWLVDDIDSNAQEYGLRNDYSERTRIGQIMLNTTFGVLKRAQNGMESRRIFAALNVSENLSPNMKQKGFMDSLKFWK